MSKKIPKKSKSLLIMLSVLVVVTIVAAVGGYYYLDQKIRTDLGKLNTSLQIYLPNSEARYSNLSIDVWQQKASIQDFEIIIDGKPFFAAERIYFSNINTPAPEIVEFSIKSEETVFYGSNFAQEKGPESDITGGVVASLLTEGNTRFIELTADVLADKTKNYYALKNMIGKNADPISETDQYYVFDVIETQYAKGQGIDIEGRFLIEGGSSDEDIASIENGGSFSAKYYVRDEASLYGLEQLNIREVSARSDFVSIITIDQVEVDFGGNVQELIEHPELYLADPSKLYSFGESSLSVRGLSMNLNPQSPIEKALKFAGYEEIQGDLRLGVERDKELDSTAISFSGIFAEMGAVNLSANIDNLPFEAGSYDPETWLENPPSLKDAEISLLDQPVRGRVLDSVASETGQNFALMIPLYASLIDAHFATYQDAPEVQDFARSIIDFVKQGGKIRLVANPLAPVSFVDLMSIKNLDVKGMINLLNAKSSYEPYTN